jgi:DNA uptake protein ComE-like DNA-binding protein
MQQMTEAQRMMIQARRQREAHPLDLNTATAEQLRGLSGIGYAYARAIIAGRPFRRKEELLTRHILPQSTYQRIRRQVVVKRGTRV